MNIFILILQFIFIPLISPFFIGLIKKVKARLQNRQGASVFQMYKDLWKLLHKDEIISNDASWIFMTAPFIIFGITLVVGSSIPLFISNLSVYISGDIVLIVYLLAVGTFFLALSGMDTGSSFGGFGSSREMTISAMAEGGLIFSLLTISIVYKTTNLFSISNGNIFVHNNFILSILLAFTGFFIVLLAESGRFPFDNPDTHLELTMVHEAMILEYSGKRLALIEWASANKYAIFASIGANIFLPYGISHDTAILSIIFGILFLLLKISVFSFIIGVIESKIAKFRFFRLPDLLLISFIFSVIALGIINQL